MHHANNMVGEIRAAHSASLWRRYFRISKHRKPGKLTKTILGMVAAVELKVGVLAYA